MNQSDYPLRRKAEKLLDLKKQMYEGMIDYLSLSRELKLTLGDIDNNNAANNIDNLIYKGKPLEGYTFNDLVVYFAGTINLANSYRYAYTDDSATDTSCYSSALDWINAGADLLSK